MASTEAEAVPAAKRAFGAAWMLAATFCFAGVTGVVRHLGTDIPAPQAAFIRYGLGVVLLAPALLALLRRPPGIAVAPLYLWRCLFHSGGVLLWFYAMARIPMAEVTAIGYSAAIFTTLGAAAFLGERLHIRRILAVAAGLLGALIVLRPGFQEIGLGQLAQLSAAPLFAASFLIAKRLSATEDATTIVAVLTLGCTLALLPPALMEWREPSLRELLWLALTAVFATLGHYCMTRAFRLVPLTVTQPIGFLQLVWAALMGVALFGEPIDPFVVLGGGVIVAAATFIAQ